jgi:hypothetical protein
MPNPINNTNPDGDRPYDVEHSFTANDPNGQPGSSHQHFWDVTPGLKLYLPSSCSKSWASSVNWNFRKLDQVTTANASNISTNASTISTLYSSLYGTGTPSSPSSTSILGSLQDDDQSFMAIVKATANFFYDSTQRSTIFGLPDNTSASTNENNGGSFSIPSDRRVINHFVLIRQIDFSGTVDINDTIFAETRLSGTDGQGFGGTMQWICGDDEMRAASNATIVYMYQK